MGLKPRSKPDPATLARAVRYAKLQGVRRADACARYGVSIRQLREGLRTLRIYLDRRDLVLAALTRSAERRAGELGDLESIAGYVDWQNHDGCQVTDVERALAELVDAGVLAIDGDRWTLVGEWP